MKLRGTTLYREGSRPAGVWIISNGAVKWSSKYKSNKHLLQSTFSHGCTPGLYEMLAEKPYICDIITDSVVLCFFIETEKLLSALRSDPVVEEFSGRVAEKEVSFLKFQCIKLRHGQRVIILDIAEYEAGELSREAHLH